MPEKVERAARLDRGQAPSEAKAAGGVATEHGSYDRHRTLRKLLGGLWYAVEVALFLPVDLLTVRIRDTVIPRAAKRRLPSLSCRRYLLFGTEVDCGPAMKYRHKGLFEAVVCKHCDAEFGECRRRKGQKAG